jgi:hypothetical protein
MTCREFIVAVLVWCLVAAPVASAQYTKQNTYYAPTSRPAAAAVAAAAATAPAPTAPAANPMKPEELEQIVAPIALYPDSLLAQVLMASTYPLEVVQADRWAKQNPTLKGSADALNKLTWDPSVKSLIDFPQVLTMMSEKLDWTVKLGDAFIADQKSVMDAVQRLRNKAYANGNLKTSKEQNVKVEPASATAPAAGGSSTQVVVIESSDPAVVYVPTYNPTVVYGAWPYPAYPPSYYYPPGYAAGTALLSFGVGVAVGAAWGHAWGGCNWGHSEVDVDIDQNVNFNSNIDREKYKAERDARQADRDTRQTDRQGSRDTRQTNRQSGQGRASSFQHDPSHRQGVAYRDSATNEKFRGADASRTSQARESYRGRTEAGRQDISRGGADSFRGNTGSTGGVGNPRAGGMDFRGNVSSGSRDVSGGTRSSGFSGSSYSGSAARTDSSRGQASRSSSSYSGNRSSSSGVSRGSGGYSGGSRSSGGYSGGSRGGGGGGMRGGGGRGGGRR